MSVHVVLRIAPVVLERCGSSAAGMHNTRCFLHVTIVLHSAHLPVLLRFCSSYVQGAAATGARTCRPSCFASDLLLVAAHLTFFMVLLTVLCLACSGKYSTAAAMESSNSEFSGNFYMKFAGCSVLSLCVVGCAFFVMNNWLNVTARTLFCLASGLRVRCHDASGSFCT